MLIIGIIVAMISYSFLSSGGYEDQWSRDTESLIVRFNDDHRLDIMCFTKYLIGVNSQNLMNCHRLVGVNS